MTTRISKIALVAAAAITSITFASAFTGSAEAAGFFRPGLHYSPYQMFQRHRFADLNPQPLPPGPPPCHCDLGSIQQRTGGLKF